MKKLVCFFALLGMFQILLGQSVKEARKVIERFAGKKLPVELSLSLNKDNGCDRFEYSCEDGKLKIKGSNGVSLCRGFYSYLKSQNGGINSWTGSRYALPDRLPDVSRHSVTSPFRHHYYYNVVTFGYTTPYWDWARWEQEIDWMALHGVDLPLALVANEAITLRVFKKLGLTEKEINEYFTGPAHLPWMRMGNVSAIDSPLPAEWHEEQVELQHKILKRMRSLGMKPVCPGFAGFVPKGLTRLYPDADIVETNWCGFKNWMLMPNHPLFRKIGKLFIEEWEREFGKNEFYIIDSFNEIEVPFPPKGTPERYTLLAQYGETVYGSVKDANPDATWVMQGWMFGYDRGTWDKETLQALLSKIPDDKMMLLDLAVDVNLCRWRNGTNYELHDGFYNKQWVYSLVPNMGGETGLTGNLEFYANAHLDALKSSKRGNLVGHGTAPEGVENNEVVFEMIADAGWSDKHIDLDKWLENYSICRYGAMTPGVKAFWNDMCKSVYGSLADHPRFNWQFRPGRVKKGSVLVDSLYYSGIDHLAEAIEQLGDEPLFRADMIEMTAQSLAGKMELIVQLTEQALLMSDPERCKYLEDEFMALGEGIDRLLVSHPTMRLENWIDFARKHGSTEELKDYYETNARRIVTIWGPPVDDYAARLWSGLVRDYYVPRWKNFFESRRAGKTFDHASWERRWVEENVPLSAPQPYDDPMAECVKLLKRASKIQESQLAKTSSEEIGTWTPADVTTQWKEVTWNVPMDKLSTLRAVRFNYTKGSNKLEIDEVVLEIDGKEICRVKQHGETGVINRDNMYLLSIPKDFIGNNDCRLRAKVRSDGKAESYGKVVLVRL